MTNIKNYKKRILETKIQDKLKQKGAVSIEGPKWCGKTWCGLHFAASFYDVADPTGQFANRKQAILDPFSVLLGKAPHLIDEWQAVPGIWDAVKHEVDNSKIKGRFILTGSSSPNEHEDDVQIHSGAGRISRIKMRTMTLSETNVSDSSIKLTDLFKKKEIKVSKGNLTLDNLINISMIGGWPQYFDEKTDLKSAISQNKDYVDAIIHSKIKDRNGATVRDSHKMLSLLKSISRNISSLVTLETIIKDVKDSKDDNLSKTTVATYLDVLRRLYIIEEIPPFSPTIRSSIRLRKSAKLILTDPSLAVATLNASASGLKADLNTFGFVFENLVLRDLLVYSEAIDASIAHYHDNTDLEIDAIITKEDDAWGAFEIKLGIYDEEKAANNLLRLKNKMKEMNRTAPSFLGIIIGVGAVAHKRKDGVYIIPIDKLGV